MMQTLDMNSVLWIILFTISSTEVSIENLRSPTVLYHSSFIEKQIIVKTKVPIPITVHAFLVAVISIYRCLFAIQPNILYLKISLWTLFDIHFTKCTSRYFLHTRWMLSDYSYVFIAKEDKNTELIKIILEPWL